MSEDMNPDGALPAARAGREPSQCLSRPVGRPSTNAVDLITQLWGILDDIDTVDDMAKADDKLYRELVGKLQAKRWELGITTDGYSLTIPATPYNEHGVHMQHCGPLNDGVCKYGDLDCPACDPAQADRSPQGQDGEAGLVHEGTVAASDAPLTPCNQDTTNG